MYNLIRRVLGWILLWFTLYRTFCRIMSKKSAEYNCRMVTLFHATIITVTSCYITFFSGTNPYSIIGSPNTHAQIMIMTISLGYFLYDFTWCMYHSTEGPVMLLHHIISITIMTASLYLGFSGVEVVATIFGSEITSVFLNIRWFMKDHNVYNDKLAGLMIDFVFVLLFLGVRIGVGGSLVFSVLRSARSTNLVKFGGCAFYLVNCLFFAQIISFARHRFLKWSEEKKVLYKAEKDNSTNGSSPLSNGEASKQYTNGTKLRQRAVDQLSCGDNVPPAHCNGDFENSPFLSN